MVAKRNGGKKPEKEEKKKQRPHEIPRTEAAAVLSDETCRTDGRGGGFVVATFMAAPDAVQ